MSKDQKPPEGIKPQDVASQFLVLRTHDNRVAVQFPSKGDGAIDALESLKLLATGLSFLAETLHRQQAPVEQPRIVVAPAVPKEFLTKRAD